MPSLSLSTSIASGIPSPSESKLTVTVDVLFAALGSDIPLVVLIVAVFVVLAPTNNFTVIDKVAVAPLFKVPIVHNPSP